MTQSIEYKFDDMGRLTDGRIGSNYVFWGRECLEEIVQFSFLDPKRTHKVAKFKLKSWK